MIGASTEPIRPIRKWRPHLSLIVFLVLSTVLSLPLASLSFFRIDENQLIHQTEGELIAQSAVLAAIYRREVEREVPESVALGAKVEPEPPTTPPSPYRPILPRLDLTRDDLLGLRPDARAPVTPADPAYVAVGSSLAPLLPEIRRVTLSGYRLLDPNGVVIAGQEEVGLSLAHVAEVADALKGHFRSVLRLRIFSHEPPPLYSVSRGTSTRIFVAMPVIARDRVAGVVYLSRTPSNIMKQLYDERGKVAAAAGSAVLLTLLIGFVFHRVITLPVRQLILRTVAIGNGDRSALQPLKHHGTAEFAHLANSLLDMAIALHGRADFISTFAAHVSHELKSPLTSIKGAAELLRDDLGDHAGAVAMSEADRKRFLDNIIGDAGRLTIITERLRDLARAENPPLAGRTVVSSLVAEFAAAAALPVNASGDLDCAIQMSPDNARIVLSHLADNAAQHGGTALSIRTAKDRGGLRLVVQDNGSGISANNRPWIFDSFFTTRREHGGTGMGLAIVRAMLHSHGGTIALLDTDRGAAFELWIPFAGMEA